jgi:protein-L-isoaspartate(D-aspartate) O-methyltransferase
MALLGLPLATPSGVLAQDDPLYASRLSMVEREVRKRGVQSPRVLDAMREVPRHLFVPESMRPRVYDGKQLPFAPGQQLSHAFLSARMIELLELDGSERVLEIGTGSGYDAALLAHVAKEVYTVEIDPELGKKAKRHLQSLGYNNVSVHVGDGYRGLPEFAPYDAILLTTAPGEIPEPLFDQLKVGGRLVAAVGSGSLQDLLVFVKTAEGRTARKVIPVRLGRMTGEAQTGLRRRD